MPLRPSDIEHKTFSTALRGYDLGEVDDFLDEVVGTIRDLEERVTALQAGGPVESGPAPDPVDEATAVGRALIMAQETAERLATEAKESADQVLGDARTEADQIRTEARAEADRIRGEARVETDNLAVEREAVREEASKSIAALTGRVAQVRAAILALTNLASERVSEMDVMLEEARGFLSLETASATPVGGPASEGFEVGRAKVDSAAEGPGDGYTPDEADEYPEDAEDSDDFDDEYGSEDTEDEPDTAESDEDDEDGDEDDAVPDDPDFESWNPGRSDG